MDIVGNKTLRDMWDELAQIHNQKTALIFEDFQGRMSEFTYSELNEEINKTANLFLDLGIKKGERVAVQLHGSPEFLMCWFGLAKIGAVLVPINTQYKEEEMGYILDKCGVTHVVIEEQFLPIYENRKASSEMDLHSIIIARSAKKIPGTLNFADMRKSQPGELKEIRPLSSDDTAEILFTSGTTSNPKGAVLTHCNIIFSGIFGAWEGALTKNDRFLTVYPPFHVDFQLNAVVPAFTVGATMIIVEKYHASTYWKQICDYKVTFTHCIPMIVRTLLLQPQQEWEKNHCIRDIFFCLSLTDKEKADFEERFAVKLLNCYGSTETLVGVITDFPFDERKWPSVGKAGLSYEAKIVDSEGNELPPNSIGEICIKGVPGRTLFKEYYNDPEATAKTLKPGGWMYTGDKGYADEAGWFYFVDRKVNMIKRSGENISATEIEKILMDHPKIAEAAVIGVPDPVRDQAVKAFILLKEGEELSTEEILSYSQSRMAEFKVPSFIEIITSFPRTCTGKVQKKLLH
nr:crotonobetaine/carnitine-CoA ligase [uncultured Bacillus sp.]